MSDPNDAGTNVLIHTSAMDGDGDKSCLDFLTVTPPHQLNVLFISYLRTADDWLRTWLKYAGERPAQLGIVQVGATTRSTATTPDTTPRTQNIIETVANPHNLTELGITISEYLTEWKDNFRETVICFDSITALLQYTGDVQTAFRFLHTLVGRVQTAEARACYTITPDAHDDQTVATLTSLFDNVLK